MSTEIYAPSGSFFWSSRGLFFISSCLAVQVLLQIRKYVKRLGAFGWPDHYVAFAPFTLLSVLLEWGLDFQWDKRFSLYRKSGKEVITIFPIFWGEPMLLSNSFEVIKQTGGNGSVGSWHKPYWQAKSSLYWGPNLLAANDVEWRNYRKILQPAFNTKTYEYVWDEATRLYNEMLQSEDWSVANSQSNSKSKSITVQIPAMQEVTTRIALSIVMSAGFGLQLSWSDTSPTQSLSQSNGYGGDSMRLSDGVKIQADNVVVVAEMPFLLDLPVERFRKVKRGLDALRKWFKDALVERRDKISQAVDEAGDGDFDDLDDSIQRDILTRLILTSLKDKRLNLQDDQIIGNTWVMMFAGHETTASTLSATLAFLAANPAEQAIVHDEIDQLIHSTGSSELNFGQYESLPKVRAAFVEALRMIPAGSLLIRESREDTVLRVTVPNSIRDVSGDKGDKSDWVVVEKSLPVPKGICLLGDMIGVQYNPRYFPEPETYRPSRWYEATSDDAYTAFSGGPRTCIGRKFALTEAVCWLANFLRDWEVIPLLDSKKGESLEEWKERVMGRAKLGLSLSMGDAPLVLKRR